MKSYPDIYLSNLGYSFDIKYDLFKTDEGYLIRFKDSVFQISNDGDILNKLRYEDLNDRVVIYNKGTFYGYRMDSTSILLSEYNDSGKIIRSTNINDSGLKYAGLKIHNDTIYSVGVTDTILYLLAYDLDGHQASKDDLGWKEDSEDLPEVIFEIDSLNNVLFINVAYDYQDFYSRAKNTIYRMELNSMYRNAGSRKYNDFPFKHFVFSQDNHLYAISQYKVIKLDMYLDVVRMHRFLPPNGTGRGLAIKSIGNKVVGFTSADEIFFSLNCMDLELEQYSYEHYFYDTLGQFTIYNGWVYSSDLIPNELGGVTFGVSKKNDLGITYPVIIKTDSLCTRPVLDTGHIITHEETEVSSSEPVSFFPNPTTDVLNVRLNEIMPDASVSIYTITGQLIIKQSIIGLDHTINLRNNPTGVYVVRVQTVEKVYVEKIVRH